MQKTKVEYETIKKSRCRCRFCKNPATVNIIFDRHEGVGISNKVCEEHAIDVIK